jgi:hypothetical protein
MSGANPFNQTTLALKTNFELSKTPNPKQSKTIPNQSSNPNQSQSSSQSSNSSSNPQSTKPYLTSSKPKLRAMTSNPNHSKSEPNPNSFLAFLRRHAKAIITIVLVIVCLALLYLIDKNTRSVNLTIDATDLTLNLQRDNNNNDNNNDNTNNNNDNNNNNNHNEPSTNIPVRILSYNADIGAPLDLLYYVDTIATVTPASGGNSSTTTTTLTVNWDIPDTARNRATYTELCIRDHGERNNTVSKYCMSADEDNTNTINADYQLVSEDADVNHYNKISCAYYLPAHSVGILAWWSNWNKFNDNQRVGCAGSALENNQNFGDSSYLHPYYGFGLDEGDGRVNVSNTGDVSSSRPGLTLQNFFQSILNAQESHINVAEMIGNSFTRNFTYNRYTHQVDLSPTGADPGTWGYWTGGSTKTIHMPVITVDKYGRITNIYETTFSVDGWVGNEVVGPVDNNSALTRYGRGTPNDPYTLGVNTGLGVSIINNAITVNTGEGIKINNYNQVSINSPTCTVESPVLTWNGKEFKCVPLDLLSDTQWQLTANNDADTSVIKAGDIVSFDNGTGTIANRNGNDISYSLTETGVEDTGETWGGQNSHQYTANRTYGVADHGTISVVVPKFTVDKWGRLVNAGYETVKLVSGSNAINIDSNGNISVILNDNAYGGKGSGLIIDQDGLYIKLGDHNRGLIINNDGELEVNVTTACDTNLGNLAANNYAGYKKLIFDGEQFNCSETLNTINFGDSMIGNDGVGDYNNDGSWVDTNTGEVHVALPKLETEGNYGYHDGDVYEGNPTGPGTLVTDGRQYLYQDPYNTTPTNLDPSGNLSYYGQAEWNIPILTVDEHGRIVAATTDTVAVNGSKAIYIIDNNGTPELALRLCGQRIHKEGDQTVIDELGTTSCSVTGIDQNTANSGLKIAAGGLGINLKIDSGLIITADNYLQVNMDDEDRTTGCNAGEVLTFNSSYKFACVSPGEVPESMAQFYVGDNYYTANHDRADLYRVTDSQTINFKGTSYDNNTNTNADQQFTANPPDSADNLGQFYSTGYTNIDGDKIEYNNIEVDRCDPGQTGCQEPGATQFSFNLGETGVYDNNLNDTTVTTNSDGLAQTNGTKTAAGAAGALNYTCDDVANPENDCATGTKTNDQTTDQSVAYYIPTITVDKYGRLTNISTTNAWNLTAGAGLFMDADGKLSIVDVSNDGIVVTGNGLYVHLIDNATTTKPAKTAAGAKGGLMISDDKLQINAPVCNNTGVIGAGVTGAYGGTVNTTDSGNDGRLTWDGEKFVCQYITASDSGTYGSLPSNTTDNPTLGQNNPTGGAINDVANTVVIPVITIDPDHEFTVSTIEITGGYAITIDDDGNINLNDDGYNGLTLLGEDEDTLYIKLLYQADKENPSAKPATGEAGATGGLMIMDDTLQINAPVCNNTGATTVTDANGGKNDETDAGNDGRLTWDGEKFGCEYITQTAKGIYGYYDTDNAVVTNTINIPVITVNANHEISFSTQPISGGDGITINQNNGVIGVDVNNGLRINTVGEGTAVGLTCSAANSFYMTGDDIGGGVGAWDCTTVDSLGSNLAGDGIYWNGTQFTVGDSSVSANQNCLPGQVLRRNNTTTPRWTCQYTPEMRLVSWSTNINGDNCPNIYLWNEAQDTSVPEFRKCTVPFSTPLPFVPSHIAAIDVTHSDGGGPSAADCTASDDPDDRSATQVVLQCRFFYPDPAIASAKATTNVSTNWRRTECVPNSSGGGCTNQLVEHWGTVESDVVGDIYYSKEGSGGLYSPGPGSMMIIAWKN